MSFSKMELQNSELVRIWKDKNTGEFKNSKENEDDEPTKLVYDSGTRIMYYKFEENGVGYMSPYISSDGLHSKIFFDNEELPF